MSVFERTSRSCDLAGMAPALREALATWAAESGDPQALDDALACCETTSLRRGAAGIYGRMASLPTEVVTGAVLTGGRLVWATLADDRPAEVAAVRLSGATVVDYRESTDYRRMIDTGLQLGGGTDDDGGEGTLFLGLGDDVDGRAFLEAVLEAWRTASR